MNKHTVFDYIKEAENELFYFIIDILAHEYGWTIEYIMNLPISVIVRLLRAIKQRHALRDQLDQMNIAKGFTGNISPNFPEKPAKEVKEDELKNLELLAKKLNLKIEKVK